MYLLLSCEGWNYSNSTGKRSNIENLPEKFQNWTKIILAPVNVPGTSQARSAREGETDGTIHIGTVDFAESTVIVCDAFWRNVLQRQKKDSRLCYFPLQLFFWDVTQRVAWHPKTAAKETNIVSVLPLYSSFLKKTAKVTLGLSLCPKESNLERSAFFWSYYQLPFVARFVRQSSA